MSIHTYDVSLLLLEFSRRGMGKGKESGWDFGFLCFGGFLLCSFVVFLLMGGFCMCMHRIHLVGLYYPVYTSALLRSLRL